MCFSPTIRSAPSALQPASGGAAAGGATAGDLNVAPDTVARAYADLREGGRLVSDGRRGTRVARRSIADDQRARGRTLRETITQFVHTLEQRGYSLAEIAEAIERALPA